MHATNATGTPVHMMTTDEVDTMCGPAGRWAMLNYGAGTPVYELLMVAEMATEYKTRTGDYPVSATEMDDFANGTGAWADVCDGE